MDEKTLEKMLDNLIDVAKPEIIEELNNTEIEEVPEVEFSEEHKKAMEKIFALARNVEGIHKRIPLYKKVASVLVAVVLISGITITSFATWGKDIASFFLNVKDEYSEIITNKKEGYDWLVEDVYFGYVPIKYKFINYETDKNYAKILFSSNENYFVLESYIKTLNNKINTESGDCLKLDINQENMVYKERDGLKILTWIENDRLNSLMTDDSKDILIHIAQKIEFEDK